MSDGAKCDNGNIQEIFATDITIAIPDPIYPVYLDTNVMAGPHRARSARAATAAWSTSSARATNGFIPALPEDKVDLIYLCFPNNPTGGAITKPQLKQWVDYARANQALILYDAAYETFIRDDALPHSIFEIEGAREVAIEFRSFSKQAGFTGTRCAYTVVPEGLHWPTPRRASPSPCTRSGCAATRPSSTACPTRCSARPRRCTAPKGAPSAGS